MYDKEWREANLEHSRAYAKEYYKIWNKENAVKVKGYQQSYRHRIRMAVLALLGGKCVRCGFEDWRALQVDHLCGGGRKEERALGGHFKVYKKILSMGNPEKEYQILCANCNWIKRYENKECSSKCPPSS